MKKTIGIGIVGCGTISDVYLTNITQHYKNLKVVACADMFLEKAEQTKEKYHLPKACTVEELLADEEVKIVVNLTIPMAHYEINKKALLAGKHVYCEKPLALDLKQANEIAELAAQKELMAVSAPDTFLGAGAQTCRKLIDDGVIGTPISFTANMTCPGHELWHPAPAFYYKQGGGPMLDMGPYYITTLVSLLGPIKKISCFAVKGRPVRTVNGQPQQTEVPTHYSGIMEFVNGAVGTVTMSFDVWDSSLPLLEIFGTDGSISVPDPNMFCGEITAFHGKKLTNIVEQVSDPHPAKLMTMVTRKQECKEVVVPLFPADPDPRCNMRGLGVSDMAQALIDGRCSRLNVQMSRHVVEALTAFEIASETGNVYEMTTTCERPQPMCEDAQLWEAR